jgi:hypothetical protein
MAQDGIGASFVFADDDKRANALTIQSQVLGKRYRDQRFRHTLRNHAHSGGVAVERGTKSLIRQVQKRNQPATLQQLRQCLPLIGLQVRAGGIVATGMNQNHIARGRPLEALHHRLEAQLMGARIVIRIALEPEPGSSQQRRVVTPGGIA